MKLITRKNNSSGQTLPLFHQIRFQIQSSLGATANSPAHTASVNIRHFKPRRSLGQVSSPSGYRGLKHENLSPVTNPQATAT